LLAFFSGNEIYPVTKLSFDLISAKKNHPCSKCSRIFEKKNRSHLYACGKKPRFK